MSKVLIDTPSGTPAIPVKAYYHEWTDLEGVRTRSVGLEVRKEFADAPLVLESDALARIACLEGEIAKRDARILGLESDLAGTQSRVLSLQDQWRKLDAELAALKAQEPVARLPACPSRAFAVANLRDLAQSVLQHDPDVGMFCDEDQAYLINELADLAEASNGDVKLYAAPVSEAKAQGVVMPRDIEKSFLEWASAQLQAPTQLASYMAGADEVARLNAAPAALAADAWIPVSERLPGEDDQVLCWCEDETVAWAEVSSHHNSFFTDMTHELLPVTHWMPLPAAPSANSDQGVV